MRQQFALIRTELMEDLRKTKEAGVMLGVSIVPLVSGALLLAFMLVHLLHWATMPSGADPASLPLWACFAIVGSILIGLGGVLFVRGVHDLRSMNPLHGDSAQALEENVHWLKETVDGRNRLGGRGDRRLPDEPF